MDNAFAAECDTQHRNAIFRDEEFEWADVVKLARDQKYNSKFTTTKMEKQASGNPFLEPAPASG